MSAILGIYSVTQKQSSWVPVNIPPENQIFRQQSAMEERRAYLNMTIEENTALFPSLLVLYIFFNEGKQIPSWQRVTE